MIDPVRDLLLKRRGMIGVPVPDVLKMSLPRCLLV